MDEKVVQVKPDKVQKGTEQSLRLGPVYYAGYGWSKQLAAIFFLGLTAVFVMSVIYRPAEVAPTQDYSSICAFKNLTGLPCPGCGLTHSFCALGKGDFTTAFAWHWLGPPLFFLLVLVWFKAVFILTNQSRFVLALDRLAAKVRPAVLSVSAFAIYGVGRIIYILAFNPALRGHSSLPKLFGIFGN